MSTSPDAPTLNSSLQPINVRYGSIDVRDIEFAILLAVAVPDRPPVLGPGAEIDSTTLTQILGGPAGTRRAGNPWSFSSREPGFIVAEFERERRWMRVAIRYDDQFVMMRIIESRGLGQRGDRIQARALGYLAELDGRIRKTVITVAQRNRYGTPVPAKLF